jgi:hypothetical protein
LSGASEGLKLGPRENNSHVLAASKDDRYTVLSKAQLPRALLNPPAARDTVKGSRLTTPRVPPKRRDATLVFEGTITRRRFLGTVETAATIDVHRVWKGKTSKQTTVYYAPRREGLSLGERDVVVIFARPQTPDLRKEDGIPPDSPQRSIWIPHCNGAMSSTKTLVKQLGPWRPPSDR